MTLPFNPASWRKGQAPELCSVDSCHDLTESKECVDAQRFAKPIAPQGVWFDSSALRKVIIRDMVQGGLLGPEPRFGGFDSHVSDQSGRSLAWQKR